MAQEIKIKRSTTTLVPASLSYGSPAASFTESRAKLFLGNDLNAPIEITDASNIKNVPAGSIIAENIQEAINEIDLNNTKNNVAQEFTKQHNFKETILITSSNLVWDLEDNQNTKLTLTNDIYVSASNIKDGSLCTLTVTQDVIGSRIMRFSSRHFKFSGGVAPTLSIAPNAIDTLRFIVSGGFLNFLGIEKNLMIDESVISSRNPALWGNSEDIIMSGSNVIQINDKGSLGYNLTPAAGSANITLSSINGVPALDYGTGTTTEMEYSGLVAGSDISSLNGMTIFIVQEVKVAGGQQFPLNWKAATTFGDVLIGSPDSLQGADAVRFLYGFRGSATASLIANVTNITTQPKLLTCVKRNNNTSALYSNGSLVSDIATDGTITLADTGTFAIGRGTTLAGQFKGLIAEYIVFPETLNITAINEINDYLKAKYSII
jgi:hypothetical protein